MPPADEICMQCHDPARQNADLLLTRSNYGVDRNNTEQRTALVVRLSGDEEQDTQGIHWHVLSTVRYVAEDPEATTITWVGVDKPDGTHEEYIAENELEISGQADLRARELKQEGHTRRMGCYDCHNRVGHEFTTPTRALDKAMAGGHIDPALPYIKKLGLDVVSQRYDNVAGAFAAINSLRATYHKDYPWVWLERPNEFQESLDALASIYTLSSNPEMDEVSTDYPSYMGHIAPPAASVARRRALQGRRRRPQRRTHTLTLLPLPHVPILWRQGSQRHDRRSSKTTRTNSGSSTTRTSLDRVASEAPPATTVTARRIAPTVTTVAPPPSSTTTCTLTTPTSSPAPAAALRLLPPAPLLRALPRVRQRQDLPRGDE
jgi:hypothetical protein